MYNEKEKYMKLNPKKVAIQQLFAFVIDLFLISLPLIVMSNMTGASIFWFLWTFYIPLSEYMYGQTIGMKIVGTKIYSNLDKSKLSFKTVLRRHIARISLVWGVVGWCLLFFGIQFSNDYIIIYKGFYSLDDTVDYSDLNEKKNSETFRDKLKSIIYTFLFIVLVIFVVAPIWHTIDTYFDNKLIKEEFKNCKSSQFQAYKDQDEISIAKCYDKNNILQYINYYDLQGQVDDKYIFLSGSLDSFYDYYTFNDGTSYLKYKTLGIQKSQNSYIEDGEKFYYYSGYRTKFNSQNKEIGKLEKFLLNYREDKMTQYIEIEKEKLK